MTLIDLQQLAPDSAIIKWEVGSKPKSKDVVLAENSSVYQPQTDNDRIPNFLARMSRLRVKKSFTQGGSSKVLDPYLIGTQDFLGSSIELKENERAYGNIRPTTGRKIFLPHHDVFKTLFHLPDSTVSNDSGKISAKGIGAPYVNITLKDLENKDEIPGLSGLENDHIIETIICGKNTETVTGCDGKQTFWRFIPGRYFLGAVPVDQITLVDGMIKLDEVDEVRFPLVSNENKPHVIFHTNWSSYTFRDIGYYANIVRLSNNNDIKNLARSEFITITDNIKNDLMHHPHFEDLDSSNCLGTWWAGFVIRQFEKDYAESQIVSIKNISMDNRHTQNTAFGGQQDFGGKGELRYGESHWSQHLLDTWDIDFAFTKMIATLLPDDQLDIFWTGIEENINKWSKNVFNLDSFLSKMHNAKLRNAKLPYQDMTKEEFDEIVTTRMDK